MWAVLQVAMAGWQDAWGKLCLLCGRGSIGVCSIE